MKFLRKNQVELQKNYLFEKNGNPVANKELKVLFEKIEQMEKLATKVKNNNFAKTKTFKDLILELESEKNENNVKYFNSVENITLELTNKLAEESFLWAKNQRENEFIDVLNNAMQNFNKLNEFEEIGLYFEEGMMKINKFYTIEDVKSYLQIILPHVLKMKS